MTLRNRLGAGLARLARPIRESTLLWRLANRYSRQNLTEFVAKQGAAVSADPAIRNVLQVGAGGELGSQVASLRDCRVVCIDRDPRRGPDVVADVCDLGGFDDESFDAVFLLEVLEHVEDPAVAIAEIHRILRKDGTLVLSTPFILEIHDAPRDYYRFTRYGLAHLLREFAHRDIRERTGYVTSALVPLVRLYKSRHAPDVFLGLGFLVLATLLGPLVSLLDTVIRSDESTSGYVGVFRK